MQIIYSIHFKKNIAIYFLFLLSIQFSVAQKVTVSNEINVRNNQSYDILPNLDDHILFYHDQGSEHIYDIYDRNLRFKRSKQLTFEKKNISVLGQLSMDSTFNLFYSFKDEGISYIRINKYDKYAELSDSLTIIKEKSKILSGKHRFAFSEDKSKVLLFSPMDGGLNMILVDNQDMSVIYLITILVKEFDFKEDFQKLFVSNEGVVYILGQKDSYRNNTKARLMLLKISNPDDISTHYFNSDGLFMNQLKLAFDNVNKNVVIAGLVSKNDENSAVGYFGFAVPESGLVPEQMIIHHNFTPEFLAEVSGKKVGKVKELFNLNIRDLVIRKDGGVILINEMEKQFTRRSQLASTGRFGEYFPPRGFVDYYHEDILILSTFPSGKEHWQRILFKKQFSQDDDGIYSSYFLFKTPSRLRLIYNDEIKNNNTVSEYVLDPMGNFDRKSVLSTEYQNLRLRFRDAIQLSGSSLLVPSEKNYKINLVKIDYN
ncbi:MAG: hypothetical protein IPM42_09975 [Saprospiraceae bacterium]|jgi:hypothetical protein|nr:hypothetical protein [Saprospiraceae bacterium]